MAQTSEQKIYVPGSSARLRCKNERALEDMLATQRAAQPGEKFVLSLSFKAEQLIEFVRKHANERGYINLGITARRENSEYGDTHAVWLDTWKPQRATQANAQRGFDKMRSAVNQAPDPEPPAQDDVPF